MSSSQRRYEITTKRGRRYWEITRTGRRVHVAYGKVGEEPREHRWVHASEEEAASAMERRARDKLKAGFSLVASEEKDWAEPQPALVNVELEVEIANDLAAVAPFLVYGDWLVDHGDARGELIALQCNLEGCIRGSNRKLAARCQAEQTRGPTPTDRSGEPAPVGRPEG